ncbi:MAG: hypothetical protein AB8C84_09770 [Oligoflexales bacterium]
MMHRFGYLILIMIYITIGLYRFDPAFSTTHQTTAFPGDGWANIGGILDVYGTVNIKGFTSFFSDTFYSLGVGGGLNSVGIPINAFWQFTYWCLSCFFDSNDVYDIIGFLGWILIAVSALHLGKVLGLKSSLIVLFSLAILGIDAFNLRMSMHLGLAVYFMPIILIARSVVFAEHPSRKNLFFLAITLWFNFYVNEYYGYYGCFIALSITSIGFLLHNWSEWQQTQFWKNLGIGVGFFCFLMLFSYPNIITKRILQRILGIQSQFGSVFHHSDAEFYTYSTDHFFAAFSSRVYPIFDFLNSSRDLVHGENTFIIGSVTFLIACCMPIISLFTSRFLGHSTKTILLWKRYFMLMSAAFVGICLSLKPDDFLSLSWITMKHAPMFRVNIRALLYTDIAVITSAFISLNIFTLHLAQHAKTPQIIKHTSHFLMLCLATLAIQDISGKKFDTFGKMRTSNLGSHDEYAELEKHPEGMLLEIPFHIPGSSLPEYDYPYYTSRLRHKKPIFNGGLPHKGNFHSTLKRLGNFQHWATVNQSALNSMKNAGIRYIVCHKDKFDVEKIRSLNGINEIADNDKVSIFSINGVYGLNYEQLRSIVWPSHIKIPVGSMSLIAGKLIENPLGHGQVLKAHRPQGEKEISIFGPYLPLESGSYRARVPLARLEKEGNLNTEIMKLEVSGAGVPADAGTIILKNKDLSTESFKEFIFDFHLSNPAELEFRIHTLSTHPVIIDEITIERPDDSKGYRIGTL